MRAYLMPLVAALAAGCHPGPTQGELGRATFQWDEGVFGCLFGCNAKGPVVARGTIGLQVTNHDNLPAYTVATDDPAVLEVKQSQDGDSYINLTTHAAGGAKVVLLDASGGVIDRLPIDVRDVTRIAPADGGLYRERFTLIAGGEHQIQLRLEDSDGDALKGAGGVDYAFGGGLSAQEVTLTTVIDEILESAFAGSTTEYVNASAKAVGAGDLLVTSPAGASLDIPAQVVDLSAIDGLEVPPVDAGLVGYSIYVEAHAYVAGERAWSPLCAWSIAPSGGPVVLSSTQRDGATVDSKVSADANVTCTIGTYMASRGVHFDAQ
jgi:hypothetical protein